MLVSILIFLLVLSILILVHELGHFIVARRAGVKVEEFGFGIPPRLIGKKIGETIYSINALPFGGFVRLHGENYEEGITDPKRAFLNKSKKVRVMVIVAGVIMNVLLAVVAFAIVYSFSGIPRETGKLKVIDVATGSPAQVAGIIVGDVITKIGKDTVTSSDDFAGKITASKGKRTVFEIQRTTGDQSSPVKITLTPRENPPQEEGSIGITYTTMEIYYPPVWQRPFYGIYFGFKDALFWGQTIAVGLWGLIAGIFKGQTPQGVSGPVGIFAVTTEAAKGGVLMLINFLGILSVNLAILNILPFPALDGGRILFIGIEAVTGRKVSPKVEGVIHNIGMIILLMLMLAITIGDIRRLITFGGIQGFLNSMVK
ncbi:MAG: M50 family metallopeptidase [Candidatus Woesebacteria bacterium]|nr:M50 family metallopeptidase [Candidatus Woesebacteria bacterium]